MSTIRILPAGSSPFAPVMISMSSSAISAPFDAVGVEVWRYGSVEEPHPYLARSSPAVNLNNKTKPISRVAFWPLINRSRKNAKRSQFGAESARLTGTNSPLYDLQEPRLFYLSMYSFVNVCSVNWRSKLGT